jgi:hypothetical protein
MVAIKPEWLLATKLDAKLIPRTVPVQDDLAPAPDQLMLSVSQRDLGTRGYVVVGAVRLGWWRRFLDKIRHNNAEEPEVLPKIRTTH